MIRGVGLPGLEPGKAGPESAVLPLHHSPRILCNVSIATAKVQVFSDAANFLLKFFNGLLIQISIFTFASDFKYYKLDILMEIKNKLVSAIVDGLQDKKGKNIVIVDLTDMTDVVCSYFVICSAGSPAQIQALTRSVGDKARVELGAKPLAVDGLRNSRWVAMDYAEVIVHIMLPEERAFYDIEHLWEDARIVTLPDVD